MLWDSAVGAAALVAFLSAAFFAGRTTSTASTAIVMWLVRLRIRYARPWARGRMRLSVGPSSANAAATTRVSRSMSWLFSAFAAALATTLNSGRAAACGANRRMSRASATGRPLISATTRRTLVGDMCTYFAMARARAGSSTAAGVWLSAICFPLLSLEAAQRRRALRSSLM